MIVPIYLATITGCVYLVSSSCLMTFNNWVVWSSRHSVLSKISRDIRFTPKRPLIFGLPEPKCSQNHLVHDRRSWYLETFGLRQKVLDIWSYNTKSMEVFGPCQRSLIVGLTPNHFQRRWSTPTYLPDPVCRYQLGFQGK